APPPRPFAGEPAPVTAPPSEVARDGDARPEASRFEEVSLFDLDEETPAVETPAAEGEGGRRRRRGRRRGRRGRGGDGGGRGDRPRAEDDGGRGEPDRS